MHAAAPSSFWLTVLDRFIEAGPAMAGILLAGLVILGFFFVLYKFGGKIVGAFTTMAASIQAMAANMETFVEEAKVERHDREKAHAILNDLKHDTDELLRRTEHYKQQGRVRT